jgi:hypothetical protein
MNSSPRIHHYEFAHRFLPTMAWQHPSEALVALASTQAIGYLSSLWRSLGWQLPAYERIEPQGLNCDVRRYGDFVIAVITLPPPVAIPEAYFTALVFSPAGSMSQDGLQQLALRYLTLEASYDWSNQEERTVLGEWTAQGGHLNYGTGPGPNPQEFLLSVCGLLEESRERRLQVQV